MPGAIGPPYGAITFSDGSSVKTSALGVRRVPILRCFPQPAIQRALSIQETA